MRVRVRVALSVCARCLRATRTVFFPFTTAHRTLLCCVYPSSADRSVVSFVPSRAARSTSGLAQEHILYIYSRTSQPTHDNRELNCDACGRAIFPLHPPGRAASIVSNRRFAGNICVQVLRCCLGHPRRDSDDVYVGGKCDIFPAATTFELQRNLCVPVCVCVLSVQHVRNSACAIFLVYAANFQQFACR